MDLWKKILISLAILGAFIMLLGGSIIWNAVTPVLQQYGLQQQAADDINRETSDSQFAMNAREWFAQQREDIDAMKTKIQNQRRQIKNFKDTYDMQDLSYSQQQQYNRMTNRLLGYQNQYETYVADYNAKMDVSYYRQYNESLPLDMQEKFWTGDLIP